MNLRSVLYLKKKKYFELVESANNLHIVVDHTWVNFQAIKISRKH